MEFFLPVNMIKPLASPSGYMTILFLCVLRGFLVTLERGDLPALMGTQ